MNTHFKIASAISKLLDNQFSILGFRFGLDPLLGLVPYIGDLITFIFSFYLILIAKQMHIPQKEINTMIRNLLFDLLLGMIPIIGDLSDFVYKANTKNMKILEKYQKIKIVEGEVVL